MKKTLFIILSIIFLTTQLSAAYQRIIKGKNHNEQLTEEEMEIIENLDLLESLDFLEEDIAFLDNYEELGEMEVENE